MRKICVALVLAVVAAFPAAADVVDLELLLMADVSGSVDSTDFDLQRIGYVNAFRSPALLNAIQAGHFGSIAVAMVYWSDSPTLVVDWTMINSSATANAFADAINAAGRPSSGGTGMTAALTYSAGLFGNAFDGTRLAIDVSGDGAESNACSSYTMNCVPLQNARNAFLSGGTNRTINALWINDRDFFGVDPSDAINALTYGTTNVIGGPSAFQSIVDDYPDFEAAVSAKLVREVHGDVPEPASLALFGLAVAGGLLLRRRRSA